MVISYKNILRFISISLWIMCILELLFFFSFENSLGVLTFIYGWYITKINCLKESLFQKFPLVVLSMFSLVLMYYYLPLIFLIFKRIYKANNFLTRIFSKIGIYKSPQPAEIWILGYIGFFAFIYSVVTRSVNNEENFANGFLPQIMFFLQNFSFVPACFFVKDLYFSKTTLENNRKQALIYFAIIIMFSIATTRRSLLMMPVFTILITSFLIIVIKQKAIRIKVKILLYIIAGLMLLQPIQDLGRAMIYVRITTRMKADDIFMEVLKIYNDKDLLRRIDAELDDEYRSFDKAGWNEQYISNEFVERYCNLKVADMSNYYVEK